MRRFWMVMLFLAGVGTVGAEGLPYSAAVDVLWAPTGDKCLLTRAPGLEVWSAEGVLLWSDERMTQSATFDASGVMLAFLVADRGLYVKNLKTGREALLEAEEDGVRLSGLSASPRTPQFVYWRIRSGTGGVAEAEPVFARFDAVRRTPGGRRRRFTPAAPVRVDGPESDRR